jgi:flavorubredoxin
MQAVPIADDIYWVGAIDWDMRDFHGFEAPHGTSYNAYLVRGSQGVALVDTVKSPFVDEMLSRVAEVVDPAEITLIVVNHLEPDHNSGLRRVMEACPGARVVASPSGARSIGEYHEGLEVDSVKDDVIDLGGLTLRFAPMPMVHWPDSMFTWCAERGVLMCNDAFGQHVASSERFADELGCDRALDEAKTYFANILMPLTGPVGKAVGKLADLGWAPEVIATSHGVLWRGEDVGRVVEAYSGWVAGETEPGVVVAYATMWDSTRALAHAVADGVASEGVDCTVFDLSDSGLAEVTRTLMDGRTLLLGSATLHHGMLYPVAGLLQWLAGLKPAGKTAGVFGSYGWSSGATEQMSGRLTEIGFEMPFDELTCKFRPTDEDLEAAFAWGAEVARSVRD